MKCCKGKNCSNIFWGSASDYCEECEGQSQINTRSNIMDIETQEALQGINKNMLAANVNMDTVLKTLKVAVANQKSMLRRIIALEEME